MRIRKAMKLPNHLYSAIPLPPAHFVSGCDSPKPTLYLNSLSGFGNAPYFRHPLRCDPRNPFGDFGAFTPTSEGRSHEGGWGELQQLSIITERESDYLDAREISTPPGFQPPPSHEGGWGELQQLSIILEGKSDFSNTISQSLANIRQMGQHFFLSETHNSQSIPRQYR